MKLANLSVAAPLEAPVSARLRRERGTAGEVRVAVIGAVGKHKGYDVLLDCARHAARMGLALRFVVVGYTCDDAPLRELGNVEITGAYATPDLPGLLADRRCHAALFLSVWPETFSYTLSEAWAAGLYSFVLDLGAPSERVRESGWGHVLPYPPDPAGICNALMNLPAALESAPQHVAFGAQLDSVREQYYGFAPRPDRDANASGAEGAFRDGTTGEGLGA
jgi:glycosyltransferase involved in cell wall biosynthesis